MTQSISLIPLCYNEENIDFIVSIIKKYSSQLSLIPQQDTLYHRLRQNYNIDLRVVSSIDVLEKGALTQCDFGRTFCFIENNKGRYFAHRDNFKTIKDWNDRLDNIKCFFIPFENEKGLNAKEIELI